MAKNETVAREEAPTVFEVPVYNLPYVQEKVDKLNKRGAKLGAEPIRVVDLGHFMKEFHNASKGLKELPTATVIGKDDGYQTEVAIEHVRVQIVGSAPKLNGWDLVAVVEPYEKGNLMRKFPGTLLEIPQEFRDVSPDRCDHCHTKRRRNETFIVHNAEKGDWKVVGRDCLADFTGCHNPEGIARYAEWLHNLLEDIGQSTGMRDGFGGGGLDYRCVPIRSFLTYVALYAGKHGFVTGKQAKDNEEKAIAAGWEGDFGPTQSTGKTVFYEFFLGDDAVKRCRAFMETATAEEQERAEDLVDNAMEYGKFAFVEASDSGLSDYGHNMKLLLGGSYVRYKDCGYVASIIPVYQRSTEKKVDYSQSRHVGEVGKKIAIPVTVVRVKDWEGQYGLTHITTMQDDDGNILTWFAPGKDAAMEIGTHKVMSAKVKRHDDRNGYKSTVVVYPKFM